MGSGSTNNSQAIGGFNSGMAAAESMSLDNHQRYAAPEAVMPQTNEMNALAKQLALLSEYENRKFEREFNPGVEQARLAEDRTIADLARATERGELPTAESNAIKRGVARDLAASGVKLGSGFNTGGNIAASIYGDKSNQYVNQMRGLLSNYLANRPRQQVTIAPQDLVSLELSRRANNMSRKDAFHQQLSQMGMQQMSNIGNRGMSGLQAAIQEAAQNRAANKQFWGTVIGAGMQAAASGAAAA